MRVICILLVVLLVISGCKKSVDNSVEGYWELRTVNGGMMAPGYKTYPPNNGNGYKFTTNRYETYLDHKIVDSGTYVKSSGMSSPANKEMEVIVLDSGFQLFYKRSNNTLTVYIGTIVADGVIATYEKQ